MAFGLLALLSLSGSLFAAEEVPAVRSLKTQTRVVTGDFDTMLERRVIRVMVPHSRTLYFTDKGRERGITADGMRDFEAFLNKKYARKLGKRPLTVVILPQTRDLLLNEVARGLGDIAAGNLSVTDERMKAVDFVIPKGLPEVREILLSGPKSPVIGSLEDLSGRTVHARRSSPYYESLVGLSQRFQQEGRRPITITLVPEALEDEDLMEMLNAGLFEFLVVDDWLARIWAQVLPRVVLRTDLVLRRAGQIGWAIRKGSPKLEKEIREYFKASYSRQGAIEARVAKYHKRIGQIRNPKAGPEWKRFARTLALFEKYGRQYGFDPLMLAAQGYQESTLDQEKRSQRGAVGVMQIMPATGAELKVGDIRKVEPNIHGGAKYMDQLVTRYFPDANFSEQERTLFAFASYNAGPGNIARMRGLAAKKGLDPDQWFNHVEVVTAAKIGVETTTYVRNIYKYFIAYKLTMDHEEQARQARERLAGSAAVP